MSKPQNDNYVADDVAERRATDALRRALTTPYKPQKEMVGKSDRPSPKKARSRTSPKKP